MTKTNGNRDYFPLNVICSFIVK